MSRAYFTEDQKLIRFPRVAWTFDECMLMSELMESKGYRITATSRIGCDRQPHDAWEVNRKDIPQIVEQLFRQRIPVEVQAEGRSKAGVIFVYDNSAAQVIDAIGMFQRNKGGN
jgi:hypothetical protein